MALSNYTELQAAVASWMNRTDLGAMIPDFIRLAESRIARDLRVHSLIRDFTLSSVIGQRFVTLPDDWMDMHSLRVTNDSRIEQLSFVPAERLSEFDLHYLPNVYSIEAQTLLLAPIPTSVYSIVMRYYARTVALETSPQNDILTKNPGVYLYGALIEACTFTMDDAAAGKWGSLYQKSIDEMHAADQRAIHSGSHLRMRR